MFTKVVGSSFRKNIPWSELRPGDSLLLRTDPCGKITGESHNDPWALSAWHEKTGTFLGYLPATTARLLLEEKMANFFQCHITELTGGEGYKTSRGINVKLNYKTDLDT